ncbi:MAG: MFS transporter [Candidatus Limnocylindrales bacterium]
MDGIPAEGAQRPPAAPRTDFRIHPAWIVAGVAFLALIGAAGFRAAPSVLIVPLQEEFGWSRSVLSLAVSINLVLYGLTAPFAAALMDRFGMRRVTTCALVLIALGSAVTVLVTQSWQVLLTWGLMVGLGTGSMALVFAATVTDRWFVEKRGLVSGILTAAGATGQLIFLPFLAILISGPGWRAAAILVAAGALLVVPLVWLFLRDRPSDIGVTAYGADPSAPPAPVVAGGPGPARRAVDALREASRTRTFWALAGAFAICGMTTNGLIGTHLIPAAHDHGMGPTAAAGLLALVGVFDVAGTVLSGWLTDRVNPRLLLAAYYAFRGLSLLALPALLGPSVEPSLVAFVVIYGLDWVATVPPTIALCRDLFGSRGTIVFGWVFASHQLGAAAAALGAGVIRDLTGAYTIAWLGAAGLCAVAAILSINLRRQRVFVEA